MEIVRCLLLLAVCLTASPVLAQSSLLSKFFFRGPEEVTAPPPLCSVSSWSKWGVKGFGGFERYRVLENAAGSPAKCKVQLVQSKAGPKPSLKQTEESFKNYFLRRADQTCKDFKVCTSKLKSIGRRQQNMMRDILLIVDSSGSIGRTNFNKARNNIADLMGLLCPKYGSTDPFKSSSPNYHQAALINFASQAVEKWDFNDKHPTSTLQSAIRNLNYYTAGTGSTCTNQAFQKAITMFDSNTKGLRKYSSIKKEVLIITDGLSNCGGKNAAIEAAKQLRDRNFGSFQVEVYALLIGSYNGPGQAEAKQYVSQPVGNHLFNIPSYEDLDKLVTDLKAAAQPCYHLNP